MFEIFFPDCVGVDLHPGCDHLPHPGQYLPVQVYLYDYISIYLSIYLSIVYIYYLSIYSVCPPRGPSLKSSPAPAELWYVLST